MKNINAYLKQIRIEIKNMFGTKGKIVLLCLLLIGAIAIPLLGLVNFGNNDNYYGGYEEELEVNGVIIPIESPLYWEIQDMVYRKEEVEANATDEKSDLKLEYLDMMINSYADVAVKLTGYEDYRMNLVYEKNELLKSMFILDHMDLSIEEMQLIISNQEMYQDEYFGKDISTQNIGDSSYLETYYDMDEIERMEKYEEDEEQLKTISDIIDNDNHEAYFNYEIDNYNNQLVEYKDQIEQIEKDIIEKPENEKIYEETIKGIRTSIENINEIQLPIMQYRLEHDIIPGSNKWQDIALRNKEGAMQSLKYTEAVSQEEYNDDNNGLKQRYDNYDEYKKAIEIQINEYSEQLLVANSSLETQKPDMNYVKDSTRNKVTGFLFYSLLFAVVAAIVSGKSIAKEFQSGTIRLLLIRPKTRKKVALSKFFAILIVFLATYGISVILNLLANGFIYGFADLTYPNYSISSGINGISFFSFIMPKILACMVTIIFGAAVAYLLSIVTRSTALSVAIPLICFAGSLILMSIIAFSEKFKWIVYTPVPYINMPLIFTEGMYLPGGVDPKTGYGVSLLIGLSVIFVALGTYFFKKKDIVN
ncbi:ABC transporter permease [Clostridium sp. DL1XJH146]